jgi:hypothetical protein
MTEYIYAPVEGWLVMLAAGWRLPSPVEPMSDHHGTYSILLWRPADG